MMIPLLFLGLVTTVILAVLGIVPGIVPVIVGVAWVFVLLMCCLA